jgi:hypothetical protein
MAHQDRASTDASRFEPFRFKTPSIGARLSAGRVTAASFFIVGQTRAGKAELTPHCERRHFYPMATSTIAICNGRLTSKLVKLTGF